jgi:porin
VADITPETPAEIVEMHTPWLAVQPDLQYTFDPSGGVLNPNGSPRRDALVLGLRSAITF